MLAGNWFGKKRVRSEYKHSPLKKGRRRKEATGDRALRVEGLEDRRMLATFIVNNFGDLDVDEEIVVGSLRQAIELANAEDDFDTIVFADFMFTHPTTRQTIPGTIFLDPRENGGQLTITQPVEILGPGAATLTIVGSGNNERIFETNIGADDEIFPVTIGGMTLAGGNLTGTSDDDANRGGAIFNREALTLIETEVTNNSATWGGGAVYSPVGTVDVDRSLVIGNSSGGGGGAILMGDGDDEVRPILTVTHSTFTGNSTFGQFEKPGFGGAIFNRSGNVEVRSSTILENTATAGGGGVASYGIADIEDDVVPIVTNLTHNILYFNTSSLGDDDIFYVRRDLEDAPLAPVILTDYNLLGAIGGTELWSGLDDDDTNEDGGNGHFYEVISVPDGISWTEANAFASFGQNGSVHLATLTSEEENDFVFPLTETFFSVFQPEDVGDEMLPEQSIGPWFGAQLVDDLWQWVDPDTNVDFNSYTNWAIGQPDAGVNLVEEPDDAIPEPFIAFYGEGGPADTWGDLADEPDGDGATPIAYVIEYEQGTNFHNFDPLLLPLDDYGGATRVFYPTFGNNGTFSPAVDAGVTQFGAYDQRGVHFRRDDGFGVDIGAVEWQEGLFVVNENLDESDGQYVTVFESFGQFGGVSYPSYDQPGDFSLREAIEFAEKNPEFDTIMFANSILNLPDPTASPAQTIEFKLRASSDSALVVTQSVDIVGPGGFELELDVTGIDPTPTINNSDGGRVLLVDDGSTGFQASVSVSQLTFTGGDVVGSGGAILNREDLTLSNVYVKDNFTSNSGGAVATRDGSLAIEGSALINNISGFQGGAVFVDQGLAGNVSTASVSNSTISGNTAARGAAIANNDGELLVEYSTVTQNSASVGAGILNLNMPNTITQVGSSIIADNLGDDIRIQQGAVPNVQSLGFNIVGTGNALNVFIQPGDMPGQTNPMLSPLTFEGGFRPVHRLLIGSPAIDAGDSAAVPNSGGVPLYDQRNIPFTRVYDGLQDTKDRIDIGAYELQGTAFLVDTASDIDNGNYAAGNLSLREAISLSNDNPLQDSILFDASLQGATIAFSGETIPITDSVNIEGLGSNLLTINGTSGARVFTIDDGDDLTDIEVNISGMTFANNLDIAAHGAVIMSAENLTIQDGLFVNNSTLGAGFNGGAVFQRNGSLTLEDTTLTANSTNGVDADGGAVYARDAELTILNSTISGNSTTQTQGDGGGIYIRGGTLDMSYGYLSSNLAPSGEANGAGLFGRESILNISHSYFTGNQMTGSNSEGAGIFAQDSDLTLSESVVSTNRTTGTQSEGAGIYLNGGTTLIQQSTISLNSTTGLTATGGGIAMVGGELAINESTLDRNTTSGINASGGSLHSLGGEVTITDSTISGSSVTGLGSQGGGIFRSAPLASGESLRLINSTVSGNSSDTVGGGIFNAGGLTEIRHTTITENSVPFLGNGGGVASVAEAGLALTRVYSSIIAGNFTTSDLLNPNSDVDAPGIGNQNTFQSMGYNLIGTGLPVALDAFNQVGDQTDIIDPMLGMLQVNGGLTSTHQVLEGSPAVNAGNPTDLPGVGNVPDNDQRGDGFSRVLRGRIDIGSSESPFAPEHAADFDSDGDVDGADFLAWQRGLGTFAAVKSDGDANSDTQVNSVDVSIWEAGFGEGTAPLAGFASGPSDGPFLAALQTVDAVVPEAASVRASETDIESEPFVAYAVLTESNAFTGFESHLAGLTLESVFASDWQTVKTEASEVVESVDRDQVFDDYSALAPIGSLPGDRSVGSQAEEVLSEKSESGTGDLPLTVDDQVFALLGS